MLHCAPLDSHRKRGFFHSSWLILPPSNLLHWPVCLWEKLAAPSSTIHYSPQASSVTLQCFRSPVASTPQQPKMLQYVSVSHSPTSKCSVSGCCMPVSSQNLANPGSSLCLSPSDCACDCVCCDWPGLKGKPGGEGKCRTSACMCRIETLSLWVAVLMRVGGGWEGGGGLTTWIHCTKCTGIVIYIRKASGFILKGLGGHIRKTFPTMLGLPVYSCSTVKL